MNASIDKKGTSTASANKQDKSTHLDVKRTVPNSLLLDISYIGYESTCGIKGYDYEKFHKKVADLLHNARYPFLYYCRITPPKSENILTLKDAEHVMKMKLEYYFSDLNCSRRTANLRKDTAELIISR